MNGKEYRLKRLFKHPNLLIVPMDHGITIGPEDGLIDPAKSTQSAARGGADAVIVHKGLASQIAGVLSNSTNTNCELIIHLSASTALSPDPNRKVLVSSVEQAIRLGAIAVSAHVNLGSATEADMLSDLGQLAEECDKWGLPLLAMMYVRDGHSESEYAPRKIKHAARVAQELGADIAKVNYTGSPETFIDITQAVQIPVVVAGGPRMNSEEDLLNMVQGALQAGARGAAIGRNVFQAADPCEVAQRIRQVLDAPSMQ